MEKVFCGVCHKPMGWKTRMVILLFALGFELKSTTKYSVCPKCLKNHP
jgi:hypothetical protein